MKKRITYKDAGVDIEAGDALVDRIRPLAASTRRKEVETDIGGFGGVASIDPERFPDPLLVASTDGVGTKLRVAFSLDRHDTVGIDLVAMCVNDIVVQGAEPLFFLDYFASGTLDLERAEAVIRGIAAGCRQAGCALLGGETAEMPSFYPQGEYELAGFCVGVVNRDRLLTGREIRPGDLLLGLASSGFHSNGYSLLRKLFTAERGFAYDRPLPGCSSPLGEELLRPTRIYVRPLLDLLRHTPVRGLAHITGGGLLENIPRVLPGDCGAVIEPARWHLPEIFRVVASEADLPLREMLRTFNCGIGMVVVIEPHHAQAARRLLEDAGERCTLIGEVRPREAGAAPIEVIGGG